MSFRPDSLGTPSDRTLNPGRGGAWWCVSLGSVYVAANSIVREYERVLVLTMTIHYFTSLVTRSLWGSLLDCERRGGAAGGSPGMRSGPRNRSISSYLARAPEPPFSLLLAIGDMLSTLQTTKARVDGAHEPQLCVEWKC